MEIIFWLSAALILYTYAGYPLILVCLARFRKRAVAKADILPSVSLIVAAYNEENAIEDKIKNSLSLDYPKDKMEIIMASDCSTDRTDAIIRRYESQGVGAYCNTPLRMVRLKKRGGKTAVQNAAVLHARGEILIFSDATTIFSADAVSKIVRSFHDDHVGCVGGQIFFKKSHEQTFEGDKNASEKYDEFVRTKEAEIQTTFGLTGCLYAVRKNLYTPLANDQTSDFVLPLKIIEKGYRVVCEPQATGYEEAAPNPGAEFQRRVRTTRAGIKGLWDMLHLLGFSRGWFIPFGLISHKILRWLGPYIAAGVLLSNIAISHASLFYQLTLALQGVFYLLVLAGYFCEKVRYKPKIFTFPFNFVMVNAAAVLGFIEFLKGRNEEIWQTQRN